MPENRLTKLKLFVPGILMAMTGVGVGDLATGGFAGMKLGVAVLWAVTLGAFFKYLLTEGLTRWQLATKTTLLEGALSRFGKPFFFIFGLYFFLWSYFVGAALLSASGLSLASLLGLKPTVEVRTALGLLHSAAAILLILLGGYRWFVRVMEACAVLLFLSVLVSAVSLRPDLSAVLGGLFVPRIPEAGGGELTWTIALMGGVGGTLTILCYGYWIREEGRERWEDLGRSRLDLALAYALTALFGMAMVVIGAGAQSGSHGMGLIFDLSSHLERHVSSWVGTLFLLGAWGAIFSSLLGVWQSVPLLFVDGIEATTSRPFSELRRRRAYRTYLLLLGTVPMLSLFVEFRTVQKFYSVFGAFFMPMLALVLLWLNNDAHLVGKNRTNGWGTNALLAAILLFFIGVAAQTLIKKLGL